MTTALRILEVILNVALAICVMAAASGFALTVKHFIDRREARILAANVAEALEGESNVR